MVTFPVAGLQPGTTYHYRVVATNEDGDGTAYGPDTAFTTTTDSASPVISPFPPAPATPVGPVDPVGPPAPVLGKSLGVTPRAGNVTVRRPGKRSAEPLKAGSVVPVGSVVDASQGSLNLTSELPSGTTQTGQFGGARFSVRQGRNGYVDLYLRSKPCKRARKGTVASAAGRKRGKRLFGRDRGGRFRTHGRNSHATVRGTRWSVEDTCKGTVTKVTEGAVVVRDFAKKKNVLVKAGKSYLARPRR